MLEKGLKELYIDELKDLYNAENQLVKALPKMAKRPRRKNYVPDRRNIWSKPRTCEPAGAIFKSLGENPKEEVQGNGGFGRGGVGDYRRGS